MLKFSAFRKRIQTVQASLRIGRAVRLVWRSAPRWTLVNSSIALIQGLLPLAALFVMKHIIDAAAAGIAAPDKEPAFQHAAVWVLLAGLVAILTALTRLLGEYASEAQSLHMTDAVSDILHAQSIAVDLAFYEDPEYYDTLHRAQKEAPFRPSRIVSGLIQLVQNCIALFGIVGLLFVFNPWLALVLFLGTLPGAFLRLLHSRRLFRFEQEQTEKERRAWYYHGVITDVPHAKEQRLFNLGALFRTRYQDLRRQIREGKLLLTRRRVLSELFAQMLAIAALFGSLAFVAYQAIQGRITIGELTMYYLAFQSGLNFLQTALRTAAGLYEDNLFLINLFHFLDIEPKITAPRHPHAVPRPMQRGIAFHNVGFSYASREKEALSDIGFTLAPGEIIAFVGENGSGKTTLIKLLSRLYDPTRGAISVDGVDLRDLDPVQWRREISVAFQDYAHYALTARENIWLGDVEAHPDPTGIEAAGLRSGADTVIRRLPRAYDTVLGHRFQQGQELSMGEWQKIALARTFWRDARILILDEPTSSLDPFAEAELFRRFREILEGRSAILISHRFSTVQMADCIYVMDQGRIVERGPHKELLAKNGRYARLYRAQAQHYQER